MLLFLSSTHIFFVNKLSWWYLRNINISIFVKKTPNPKYPLILMFNLQKLPGELDENVE